MNLLTIIVLVIFAVFILRGYRRGFVKSLASMASLLLSIVLVNFATPYVSEFLKTQTPVYDYVLEKCEDTFNVTGKSGGKTGTEKDGSGKETDSSQASADESAGNTSNSSQTIQNALIEQLPVPEVLQNLLKENNTPEYYRKLAAQSFAEYVPRYMAGLILSIISFVVTLLLVISFIWLAVMTLDVIAGLPVIRGVNQLLGLVLGFLQGLIVVWVAFLIITVFSHTEAGKQLMQMIAESPVLEVLYDTNVLLDFLTGILGKIG